LRPAAQICGRGNVASGASVRLAMPELTAAPLKLVADGELGRV
jgi:hypothetical protein